MSHLLALSDSIAGRADALPRMVHGAIVDRSDAPPAFVCSWANGGVDAAWVQVSGELDLATAPELERTLGLAELQAGLVVLDLRELAFMDCSGLHAIVNASIHARQLGRRLILLRGPRNVDRLFTLTGCSDAVEIDDIDHVESPVDPLLHLDEDGPVL